MGQTNLLSYFNRPIAKKNAEVADRPVGFQTLQQDSNPVVANHLSQHDLQLEQESAVGSSEQNDVQRMDQSQNPGATTYMPSGPTASLISPTPFTITKATTEHIPALSDLTTAILPVRYTKKFYTEVTSDPDVADFTRVVLYHDEPVGWIACRLITPTTSSPPPGALSSQNQIYIRALCVLAPYREQGLASRLLKAVLDPELLARHKVSSVHAHVWESNEDALDWYEKRAFRRDGRDERYYTRLKPSGAWILRRRLSVTDYLALPVK